MKSLNIIQTIAKIAKIVCQILVVLYIIAIAASAIGLAVTFFSEATFEIGELVFDDFLHVDGDFTLREIRVLLAELIVVGTAELVTVFLIKRYLNHELAACTPFTFEGANELLWLGIKTLSIFVGAMAICGILCMIVFGNAELAGIEMDGLSIGKHGVEMLLLSVIFRYGAEVKQSHN